MSLNAGKGFAVYYIKRRTITTQLSDVLNEPMVQENQAEYTLANFSTEEDYDASYWTVFRSGIIYWGEASGWIKNS